MNTNTRTHTVHPWRSAVGLVIMLALAFGSLVSTAPKASADTVTITARVVGSAVAEAEATAVASASASSYAYAVAQIRSTATISSSCYWTTGTNSYYASNTFKTYYDPVKSKVCKLKKPIKKGGTTWYWKKVGGGTSGANCGNLFKPGHKNVTYKRAAYLDVKSGTTAKVAVSATADVTVAVKVKVTLEYTYQGVTKQVVKEAGASDSDHASDSATASMTVTKATSTKTTGAKIASARATVKTKAVAKAKASAIAKARAKAVAEVSVVIEIEVPNQPPSGSILVPQHLYVGGTFCAKFYGSDPEDKANVEMTRTISGPASFVSETGNCSFRDNDENTQRVITQPIQAGSTPGTVSVKLDVEDSDGKTATVTYTFPVLADDFPGDVPATKTVRTQPV